MSRVQAVGLFFIIPLMGTYLGLREIQLNADTKLLENCPEKQEYCPGRREALQRLVKASKSLAYFDLDNANLYKANLTNANLYNANLEDANLYNANITPRQIKSTCNWDQAFYNDYWDKEKREWIIDHEANKAYIEGLKQDKASDPKTPPDCSKWE